MDKTADLLSAIALGLDGVSLLAIVFIGLTRVRATREGTTAIGKMQNATEALGEATKDVVRTLEQVVICQLDGTTPLPEAWDHFASTSTG